MGEEEADDADEKQRKCRVGADKSTKRTAGDSACALERGVDGRLVFRFPKGKDQDRGKNHDCDVDIKQDPDPIALDEPADEGRSDGKTG